MEWLYIRRTFVWRVFISYTNLTSEEWIENQGEHALKFWRMDRSLSLKMGDGWILQFATECFRLTGNFYRYPKAEDQPYQVASRRR